MRLVIKAPSTKFPYFSPLLTNQQPQIGDNLRPPPLGLVVEDGTGVRHPADEEEEGGSHQNVRQSSPVDQRRRLRQRELGILLHVARIAGRGAEVGIMLTTAHNHRSIIQQFVCIRRLFISWLLSSPLVVWAQSL